MTTLLSDQLNNLPLSPEELLLGLAVMEISPVVLRQETESPVLLAGAQVPRPPSLETTINLVTANLEPAINRLVEVANLSAIEQEAIRNPELPTDHLQQQELVDYCLQATVLPTAYSPIGAPGRPDTPKNQEDPVVLEDPVIKELADAYSCTPAPLVLRWGLQRGTVVIPKTVKEHRALENLKALDIELDTSAMQRIQALDKHYRLYHGAFFCSEGSPYTVKGIWDDA